MIKGFNKFHKCNKCGKFKSLNNHVCKLKIYNKGVREYNKIVTYFLVLDRLRGATLGELKDLYKLDKNNIDKRIRGVLNRKYYERQHSTANTNQVG